MDNSKMYVFPEPKETTVYVDQKGNVHSTREGAIKENVRLDLIEALSADNFLYDGDLYMPHAIAVVEVLAKEHTDMLKEYIRMVETY